MDKKIILFDIDDTLVDVHPMARKIYQKMADNTGLLLEEIIAAKEKYIATLEKYSDYHPDGLTSFIYDFFKIDNDKRINPFIEEKYYLEALFPEAKNVIKKLKNDYKVGIFSEGFGDYQGRKILGLVDLFDKDLVFIERRKLSPQSVKKIPNGVTVIDDKKEVLETLKKLRPDLELVWINRIDDEQISGVKTIKNLNQLVELLA